MSCVNFDLFLNRSQHPLLPRLQPQPSLHHGAHFSAEHNAREEEDQEGKGLQLGRTSAPLEVRHQQSCKRIESRQEKELGSRFRFLKGFAG